MDNYAVPLICDTVLVDDDFVKHLFEIIEELSGDVDDPYHYPVIKILVRSLSLVPSELSLFIIQC